MIFLAVVAKTDEAYVGHCARLAIVRGALVPVEANGLPVWHVVVALARAFLALVTLALALPRVVGLRRRSTGAVPDSAVGDGQ